MKLPWYMRSNNKTVAIIYITIYVAWLKIRIIWNSRRDVKFISSGFWNKYKVWKE
jgi:hypothetical protein